MSAGRWSWKFTDGRRALSLAKEMRLTVYGYGYRKDGTFIVETQPSAPPSKPADNGLVNGRPNSFDQVLAT
jgi:hypothetical protein